MMSLINRYIAKTVIFATLLVMISVTGLTYIIELLNELKNIGVGDYGISEAALYALCLIPHDIYRFFPMLVLLGGLTGLGMLASHQELIVMRVSGVSVQRIVRAVLGAALVLMLVGVIIGEGIAPKLYSLGNKQKTAAENNGQAVATAKGIWIHEGNDFLHIERVMPYHLLENITRYEFNAKHQLLKASFANSATYQQKQWLLHGVSQTVFNKNQVTNQRFNEMTWDLALNPNLLNIGLLEPEEMSLKNLGQYTHHLVENGLQATEYQFSFWQRIFQPLTILVMLILSIPFVFSAPRSVNAGWRMVLGIIVGFIFYIVDSLLGQLSIVFQLSPFLAALLPTLLFALIGYLWILKLS